MRDEDRLPEWDLCLGDIDIRDDRLLGLIDLWGDWSLPGDADRFRSLGEPERTLSGESDCLLALGEPEMLLDTLLSFE